MREAGGPGLQSLGRANSGGLNPVDVGAWADGSALVVANYSGGTVAVLPLGPTALRCHPAR